MCGQINRTKGRDTVEIQGKVLRVDRYPRHDARKECLDKKFRVVNCDENKTMLDTDELLGYLAFFDNDDVQLICDGNLIMHHEFNRYQKKHSKEKPTKS